MVEAHQPQMGAQQSQQSQPQPAQTIVAACNIQNGSMAANAVNTQSQTQLSGPQQTQMNGNSSGNMNQTSDPSQNGHYIPIEGECPLCETPLLWAQILQKKRRLQGAFTQDDEHDDDELYIDSDEGQEFLNLDYKLSFSQMKEPIDVLELSD
ncbi:Structure-specific endonuclease subunit SLX1 homolog [Eumeta japonica]|uniref:Structure-specific endonuclease subunit SLX1 homolog n=1 Tax=Eumeta variegata TaxID=151549 RepID=A0A4C1SD99_EUMVA|nr:Structure-specific endonuclease subunit SLX1 homolog [Eumeta japonica]